MTTSDNLLLSALSCSRSVADYETCEIVCEDIYDYSSQSFSISAFSAARLLKPLCLRASWRLRFWANLSRSRFISSFCFCSISNGGCWDRSESVSRDHTKLTAEDLSCSYSAFLRASSSVSSSKKDRSRSFLTAGVELTLLLRSVVGKRQTVSIFYNLERNRKVHLSAHVEFVGLLVVLDCQSLVMHRVVKLVWDKFCFQQSQTATT